MHNYLTFYIAGQVRYDVHVDNDHDHADMQTQTATIHTYKYPDITNYLPIL
jgi:hypothetical protein